MYRYLDLYLVQPQAPGRDSEDPIRVRIVNSARYLINDSANRIATDDNLIISNRNEFEVGKLSGAVQRRPALQRDALAVVWWVLKWESYNFSNDEVSKF